jgi:hypothetical protein
MVIKSKVSYSYLNKITRYRLTHEAEVQFHISFTFPHSHQVCLDTCHSDISVCTRSADVDGWPLLCSTITFTRPLSNSLHHLRTCCTVIALAPYPVTSSLLILTGGTVLPINNEWQNPLLLLSNLSLRSPSWNYCNVYSRHLRWWLLLLSGGEYMY